MYNHSLDVFKTVVQQGSFSKAAQQLYISHTAVIKHINQIEEFYDVQLFYRSKRGISLTPAGQALYRETLQMILLSENALKRVHSCSTDAVRTIRIGTSVLYPCTPFEKLWTSLERLPEPDFQNKLKRYHFNIVSFSDDGNRVINLSENFDFFIGIFDSESKNSSYNFIKLGDLHFTICLNRNHPLASRNKITLRDLSGESLMMAEDGNSLTTDMIRQIITEDFPDIIIKTLPSHYTIDTFNICAEGQHLLLSLECWDHVHPMLKNIPFDVPFTMSYGIITYNKPSEEFLEFLSLIKYGLADNH